MTSITLSPNTRRDNVIMGNSYEVLWGQGFITDYIGNVKYQISPLSFFQVNPVQTEKTVRTCTGICRSERDGNCMGSVLRYRNNFSLPCTEGKAGLWS